MQAKTTFQKLFFGIIFAVTIMTFIKMYVVHQQNLAQKDCVTRTRQLLDYITTGETKQDFLIWPFNESTVDSAKVILDLWGAGAVFDGYEKVKTDTSLAEHIEVSYFPRKGERDTLSVELHETRIEVDWHKNTIKGAWRAALTISKVTLAKDDDNPS
jgi:hypothetical protein